MSMCAYFESMSMIKLRRIRSNPDVIHDLLFTDQNDGENSGFFDLHKSWQTLHFLLAGTPWDVDEADPASQAVLGGVEVGPDAFGYGPARFFTPDVVQKIAEALEKIDMEEIREKFTEEQFKEADLYAYETGDFDEEMEMLIDYLDGLKEFYREASDKGHAVVTYLQ